MTRTERESNKRREMSRLVGAAETSKECAEWRWLQRKNLSILGLPKRKKWPQCHKESSWQERRSRLCQNEKEQSRLSKAPNHEGGESQGGQQDSNSTSNRGRVVANAPLTLWRLSVSLRPLVHTLGSCLASGAPWSSAMPQSLGRGRVANNSNNNIVGRKRFLSANNKLAGLWQLCWSCFHLQIS